MTAQGIPYLPLVLKYIIVTKIYYQNSKLLTFLVRSLLFCLQYLDNIREIATFAPKLFA